MWFSVACGAHESEAVDRELSRDTREGAGITTFFGGCARCGEVRLRKASFVTASRKAGTGDTARLGETIVMAEFGFLFF